MLYKFDHVCKYFSDYFEDLDRQYRTRDLESLSYQ